MNGEEVVIEEITQNRVDDVVLIHLRSFKGAMSSRMGTGYLKSFFLWFIKQREAISLFADVEGGVAGYVVGAPLGYQRRLNNHLFLPALLAFLHRPALPASADIRRQIVRRFACFFSRGREKEGNELPVPCYSLVGIGVLPDYQGKGVGKHLIAEFERKARENGARAVRLSVYSNNDVARRAYERGGWKVLDGSSGKSVYYFKVFEPDKSHGLNTAD